MSQTLNTIETLPGSQASPSRLFGNEGARMHGRADRSKVAEVVRLFAEANRGNRRAHFKLQEAVGTTDFPELFGDALDRQLLALYDRQDPTWTAYAARRVVSDFRPAKMFTVEGLESPLDTVVERDPYPEDDPREEDPIELSVTKRGRVADLSWETIVNDDLDAFQRIPNMFATAANLTEEREAAELLCDADGPVAPFFDDATNGNVLEDADLSIEGLQDAYTKMASQVDEDGDPILVTGVTLVVPPAQEVVANNIVQSIHVDSNVRGGTGDQRARVNNWLSQRIQVRVNPYLPIVNTSNGDDAWYLVANPSVGKPAFVFGFLRGHEGPSLWVKSPTARQLGGGDVGAMEGDFETDSIRYRIRHVLGSARVSPKMAVASHATTAA